MSRLFYHVMQDNVGNLLFGVTGTMRLAGTGTAATIYGDEALTVPIPNPMTNHPSFGSFKCYLGPGTYDFYMAKGGYTFETLTSLPGGGSMANQDASAVAITGGTATFTGVVQMVPYLKLGTGDVTHSAMQQLFYDKAAGYNGLLIRNMTGDASLADAIVFLASSSALVGSIHTNATTTTYNTTSDVRLKHAITPLTGALDIVRRLRPITHLWRSDDSPGVGFLAHEVQAVAPEAVTGERDAVDEAGHIVPQGMDYGKLVPYLVAAVKELTQQVEMLTAKLAGASA